MEDQEAGWHNVANGRVRSLPNNGQGDCLFRSISHQLCGAMQAPHLREAAVNYMAAHIDEFHPQLLSLAWDMQESGEMPAGTPQEELTHRAMHLLRLPWTWGGAESIAAICRLLGRRVIVYRENAESVHFEPPPQAEERPALRLLHRQGQDGRRTHYESVLRWEPDNQAASCAGSPDPDIQPASSSCPSDNQAASSSGTVGASQDNDRVVNLPPHKVPRLHQDSSVHDRSVVPPSAPMQLRPRKPRNCGEYFHRENFSDAEAIPRDELACRQFKACKICDERVGRYALINCGLYSVCGTCIKLWFIENHNACTDCAQPVTGWFKVYPQN